MAPQKGCMSSIFSFYRPRSEASEGYVFTGVCHSVTEWGGGGGVNQRPGHNTSLPPPGPGHGTWSQHPPPPQG